MLARGEAGGSGDFDQAAESWLAVLWQSLQALRVEQGAAPDSAGASHIEVRLRDIAAIRAGTLPPSTQAFTVLANTELVRRSRRPVGLLRRKRRALPRATSGCACPKVRAMPPAIISRSIRRNHPATVRRPVRAARSRSRGHGDAVRRACIRRARPAAGGGAARARCCDAFHRTAGRQVAPQTLQHAGAIHRGASFDARGAGTARVGPCGKTGYAARASPRSGWGWWTCW
ncbi:hypothetical protein ACU4HD_20965 [Cupriavidus basilensis]